LYFLISDADPIRLRAACVVIGNRGSRLAKRDSVIPRERQALLRLMAVANAGNYCWKRSTTERVSCSIVVHDRYSPIDVFSERLFLQGVNVCFNDDEQLYVQTITDTSILGLDGRISGIGAFPTRHRAGAISRRDEAGPPGAQQPGASRAIQRARIVEMMIFFRIDIAILRQVAARARTGFAVQIGEGVALQR
jgi:hypothetical protein